MLPGPCDHTRGYVVRPYQRILPIWEGGANGTWHLWHVAFHVAVSLQPQSPQELFSCSVTWGPKARLVVTKFAWGPALRCTCWICRYGKGQATARGSLQASGPPQSCLPSHMSFPECMPAACGGCGCHWKARGWGQESWFSSPEMPARAPGPALLRAGDQLGNVQFPCHCGLQQQPLGRRKSPWRAAQARHADETKEKGKGYWRGDGCMFLGK